MVQCFVKSCKNRSDSQGWKKRCNNTSNVKIKFHSFPKNPTIRKMWLDILGVNSSCIPNAARICSIHFKEKCFDRRGLITRLKPNALPSLSLNSNAAKQVSIDDESSDKTVLQKVDHSLVSVRSTENKKMKSLLPLSKSKVDKSTMVSADDLSNLSENGPLLKQLSTSKADKETIVSRGFSRKSEKSKLRKRIQFLELEIAKKIRSLQQRARQYNDQVVILKNALKTLKNNQLLNER